MERLLCPFRLIHNSEFELVPQCKQECCAWWNQEHKKCAVVMLAERFDAVTAYDGRMAVRTIEVARITYPPPTVTIGPGGLALDG